MGMWESTHFLSIWWTCLWKPLWWRYPFSWLSAFYDYHGHDDDDGGDDDEGDDDDGGDDGDGDVDGDDNDGDGDDEDNDDDDEIINQIK